MTSYPPNAFMPESLTDRPRRRVRPFVHVGILLLLVLMCAMPYTLITKPAAAFPLETPITIEEGSSVADIAATLHAQGALRSPLVFRTLARFTEYDTVLKAGVYQFSSPLNTAELLHALTEGGQDEHQVSLTFPEGFSVYDMRAYTGDRFTVIQTETLLPYEGYLFPDTYFVAPSDTLESLVLRMEAEMDKRLAPHEATMSARGLTKESLIILASIVEREANDPESMRMVAGILDNRLKEDMPLQVDATFVYILGKTSAELTVDDLKMDSPYNTYTNKGLPPTPIANPGMEAILAVLEPTPSDYFYYLTGNDGEFYYAKTHEEHVRNKARYLR